MGKWHKSRRFYRSSNSFLESFEKFLRDSLGVLGNVAASGPRLGATANGFMCWSKVATDSLYFLLIISLLICGRRSM